MSKHKLQYNEKKNKMVRTTLESCSTLVTALRDILCYCNAGYSSIIPKVRY